MQTQGAETTNQEFKTCQARGTASPRQVNPKIWKKTELQCQRLTSHCVHVVVQNRVVASHSRAPTCFTQFISVEIHRARRNQTISESTTSNEKRAQPLSKWSDDCTMSVGCFRTDCRAWSSSPTDANVCFTPWSGRHWQGYASSSHVARRSMVNSSTVERRDRHCFLGARVC